MKKEKPTPRRRFKRHKGTGTKAGYQARTRRRQARASRQRNRRGAR